MDPCLCPASRDLAGMTNSDKVSQGGGYFALLSLHAFWIFAAESLSKSELSDILQNNFQTAPSATPDESSAVEDCSMSPNTPLYIKGRLDSESHQKPEGERSAGQGPSR